MQAERRASAMEMRLSASSYRVFFAITSIALSSFLENFRSDAAAIQKVTSSGAISSAKTSRLISKKLTAEVSAFNFFSHSYHP
jgi:hypothetical protein